MEGTSWRGNPLRLLYLSFSLMEPHGTMCVRVVEDLQLISSNQVIQKFLSVRMHKERLTNGCPGEPHAIVEGSIESALFFSLRAVAESSVGWVHSSLAARLRVIRPGSFLTASGWRSIPFCEGVLTGACRRSPCTLL